MELIDKVKLLEWLGDHISYHEESPQLVDKGVVFVCKLLVNQIERGKFDLTEPDMKEFIVVFYNRFACQTQTFKVLARNRFHAGRLFYKKHGRKSYHACIETISDLGRRPSIPTESAQAKPGAVQCPSCLGTGIEGLKVKGE